MLRQNPATAVGPSACVDRHHPARIAEHVQWLPPQQLCKAARIAVGKAVDGQDRIAGAELDAPRLANDVNLRHHPQRLGLEHADRTPAECKQIPRAAEGHGSDARADGLVHLAGLQILDDEPALL